MKATFKQLRLFLSVIEHGSVTRAARASHITQPTASMQLRELTESVGLPIYEIVGKQFYLTAAGEELANTARAMLDEWAGFEQRMEAARGLTRGRLRIAVVSTAQYFVPKRLGGFCALYPDVDIALKVLNRDGVVRRLHANLDDLYVMSAPPGDMPLERSLLEPNPLEVIVPSHHPLVGRESVPLSALAPERFILRESGSGTRMACDRHFSKQGFQPDVRLELGSNEAIEHAVAGGLGLSVLSRHALQWALEAGQIQVLDVLGFPIHANWYIVRPSGKRSSPIAEAFIQYLSGDTTAPDVADSRRP